jgi:phosphate transport system permease protein
MAESILPCTQFRLHFDPLSTFSNLGLRTKESHVDGVFKIIVTLVAFSSVVILGIMVVILTQRSFPVFLKLGWYFIFGSNWSIEFGNEVYGLLPYILATLITSAIALLVGVPVSLGIAIFLSEMAPRLIRTSLTFIIELLAAIPSIVYGLWGSIVFGGWIRDNIETPISASLGLLPVFHGTPLSQGMLVSGLILSIMIIPTVSSVSREVMRAVPISQREAAYSLGATRWETIKIGVLSYSRSGILGAVILGLGRAMGETIAVALTIGGATGTGAMPNSFFSVGNTLASLIANHFGEASPDTLELPALIGAGLMLLASSLIINLVSALLVRRALKVKGGAIE